MKKKKDKKGFTLIEMIIYISMLALLSTVVVESLLFVVYDFYAIRFSREINQSATVAVERLLTEMRDSYEIDFSETILTTTPGKLGLLKYDPVEEKNILVEFYVNSDGRLAVRSDGVEKGVLMSKNITTSYFYIRDVSSAWGPRTMKVVIRLTSTDPRGATRDLEVSSTIALRGGIH